MVSESEILERIRARLFTDARDRLLGVYLFGSQVSGDARPDSDFDIAVLGTRSLDPLRVFDTAQELAGLIHRDVDLVDLAAATTVMRAQVVGGGRVLLDADPRRLAEFEMYTLSDYARLNEERKDAMRAFLDPYRVDDVFANKIAVIERCLARAREEFREDPSRLDNPTVEDSIVLNLQRACEASIDLAMRVVTRRRLGVPQESRGAFELLQKDGVLSEELCSKMKRMVGFRNIAVHDYQRLSRPILISILRERLVDFEAFCRAVVESSST